VVLAISVRVLLGFQRHRARRAGIRAGRSGSVTVIQRFGGGLNLNVHFHTLLLEGVFLEGQDGARCGGRLRLIAGVEEPEAIRAILAALVASRKVAARAPPGARADSQSGDGARGLSGNRTRRTPRSVRLRGADPGL
jgi:hypothetical protein